MQHQNRIFLAAIVTVLAACGTQHHTAKTDITPVQSVDTTVQITNQMAPQPMDTYDAMPLHPAYTLVNDLVHTKLDVRFDWDQQFMYGKAWLTLKPHFYSTDSLTLDAKGMLIQKVEMVQPTAQKLSYDYSDTAQLKIKLDKTYKRDEPYTVYIEYTARPNLLKAKGSAAITDAKGLYFINPKGTEPNKPRELWTQGETESNSAWFPTVDKPDAKTTLELSMTIDTGMVSLSNGIMTSSKKNSDGTHTDTWKMDQPFAPYLVMMAAGRFAVVKDKWKNIEVNYYVDSEYKPYAKEIFGNTPEMLTYYSQEFGVEYPWPKFSQVVVHDFVSGAMENVSAVVHYEELQETHRELIDENHEDIICHELSHHWFGDLVTCESWSNIPLNESFATYNEYLWLNHKYGNDEARYHITEDMQQYFAEAKNKQVPLIRYRYNLREDLFDAHSYQKGGCILRMLNDYVGDDAYSKALGVYLNAHKYGTVEVADLREAFEQVTGEDLNWFFDQWFFRAGHPVLSIQTDYDASKRNAVVRLEQVSSVDGNGAKPWTLPMAIDVYTNAGVKRYRVRFDSAKQTFTFPVNDAPLLVNVDATKSLLCEKHEDKSGMAYFYQYQHAPLYQDRLEALAYFAGAQSTDSLAAKGLLLALDDKFGRMREDAVGAIDMSDQMVPRVKNKLMTLAQRDPRSLVRAAAITKLGSLSDSSMVNLFTAAMHDSSYAVMAAGLEALYKASPHRATAAAKTLTNEKNPTVTGAVIQVLSTSGDTTLSLYFTQAIQAASYGDKFSKVTAYGHYLAALPFQNARAHLDPLYKLAANDAAWYIRYAAIGALYELRDTWNKAADSIGTQLSSLNSTNLQYEPMKAQVFQRKNAATDIEHHIAAMKKNETNAMLRSIMND